MEQEYDMEVTPERAKRIKAELIRQFEDQYGVELTIQENIPTEPA